MLDGFFPVFFTQTTLLHSAERQFVIDDLRGVHPGVTCFDTLCPSHGAIDVTGPNRRAQAEDGVVGLVYRLIEVSNSHYRQSRTETFLLQESGRWVDVGNQCRLEIETLIVFFTFGLLGSIQDLSSPFHRILHLLFDLMALLFSMQRAHESVFAQAVADFDFFSLFDQLFDESVSDIVKQIKSLDCQAGLAAIKKAAHGGGADRTIHIGIVADNHRIAATQLQCDMLEVFGRRLHYPSSGIRRTSEANLTHCWVNEQLFTDDAAGTGDN